MGFIVVLLVSLGAVCVASATECVPETEKCSKFWVKTLPHKNLMASEDELNSWCSEQDRFYQCLEDIFLEGKNGNLSYLPMNLLISRLFARDICSEDSKNRERLLNNAECINKLNTDFCILPEYLDIVTPDDAIPSTRCSQAEKTFSCIAATMILNCGFDAGRVYRAMLKITRYSDEVCGVEMSDGIPPCEGSYSKSVDREKKLSEMYYGLFHRIGSLLDEQSDAEDLVSEESSEPGSEVITEAIRSAIDNLDENLVAEELYMPEHDSADSRSSCAKDIKEYKPYMKHPHITEVLKGILFYNYSGIEYAAYWRQPEFTVFNQTVCQHLLPSYLKSTVFQCRTDYRYKDPDCGSKATVHEKITPEFIRSFDPEVPCDSVAEFGPRPKWMKEVDELYEDKRIRDQMKSSQSPIATEVPEVVTVSSALLHLISTAKPRKINREEFEKKIYLNFLAAGLDSPIPYETYLELLDLLSPYLVDSFELPIVNSIGVGNSFFATIYNFNRTEKIDNVTCSRIDECHPRGKGVWKCKWWPRQIQTCDTCGEVQTEEIPTGFGFEKYARPRNASHHPVRREEWKKLNMLHATEPSVMVESSVLTSTTPPTDESIALVFSGDAESDSQMIDNSENESEQINELDFMKDEAHSEDEDSDEVQYNLASDSDIDEVRLRIVDSLFDKDENADSSNVVYAIEDTDMEDGESEIIISTDGLLDGDVIWVSNISDLDETKYTVVSAPPDSAE